jgi:bacteriorhodopsin
MVVGFPAAAAALVATAAAPLLQVFFTSWMGYPVLFMLGQEGFYHLLSPWGSVVGHCVVDVLSKNVGACWGRASTSHMQKAFAAATLGKAAS